MRTRAKRRVFVPTQIGVGMTWRICIGHLALAAIVAAVAAFGTLAVAGTAPGGTAKQPRAAFPRSGDAVAEVGHPVAEPALVHQLELHTDAGRKRLGAASDHDRRDEELVLVDQPGSDRLAR